MTAFVVTLVDPAGQLVLLQIMGNVWLPSVAVLVPYALLIVVLLWRPTGIAGKRV